VYTDDKVVACLHSCELCPLVLVLLISPGFQLMAALADLHKVPSTCKGMNAGAMQALDNNMLLY
jgi:hypothetical protein